MNNFIRTLIAGYGAKKLGGGCFSTILIFIVIYYVLGTCNRSNNTAPATRTGYYHAPIQKHVQSTEPTLAKL